LLSSNSETFVLPHFYLKPEGKRLLERSSMEGADNIKLVLKDMEWEDVDLILLVPQRNR
jgi:hypothetical protein